MRRLELEINIIKIAGIVDLLDNRVFKLEDRNNINPKNKKFLRILYFIEFDIFIFDLSIYIK